MGKLIKNHWARLIVLTAAAIQVGAGVHGIFWPKIFWDFLTTNLNGAVKPIPILQIINIVLGALALVLEWPLPLFTKASEAIGLDTGRRSDRHNKWAGYHQSTQTEKKKPSALTKAMGKLHSSIEARLLIFPLNTLAALLLYQGTNSGLYYIIGMAVYFWAFSEGEIIMGVPWTLPRRKKVRAAPQEVGQKV